MDILSRFLFPGIALLMTLALGFWVSGAGRPYPAILFNIHKLVALGTVVWVVVLWVRLLRAGLSPALLSIAALVLAAICVVALFASGALMSAGQLDYVLMLTIHRVATPLLVLSLALAIYLLTSRT